MAGLEHHQNRDRRHHGFARAHVPLNESRHRRRTPEIATDLGNHPVEVEVDDSLGGKTVQTFNVVMELEKAAEQPPAASPRGY